MEEFDQTTESSFEDKLNKRKKKFYQKKNRITKVKY